MQQALQADADRNNPEHDQITLWVMSNVVRVAKSLFWHEALSRWNRSAKEHGGACDAIAEFDCFEWEAVHVQLEKPIPNRWGQPIAFLDLFAEIRVPILDFYRDGYGLEAKLAVRHDVRPLELCFEVKTAIGSPIELIRQINYYRSIHRGQFVVVSPDDRYVDLLRSQNIFFYGPGSEAAA